jgi:hypothetical protein
MILALGSGLAVRMGAMILGIRGRRKNHGELQKNGKSRSIDAVPGQRARTCCFPPCRQRRTQRKDIFETQWLTYALPYRRFADVLAGASARLGTDVVRYAFIAVDLHHLLLAGLPAHRQVSCPRVASQEN